MSKFYRSYSDYLKEKYSYPVYRIGVDAGFSCPNRCGENKEGGCIYCDSQGATAAYLRKTESSFTHDSSFIPYIDKICSKSNIFSIKEQIERGREFATRRYKAKHFALYFQSFSNTFAPVQKLKEIYDLALEDKDWKELIISTRPDCIDEEKVKLIDSYKQRGLEVSIELGLQSGDDELLKAMNRGHDVACLIKAAELVKKYSVNLCLHVLLGFVGEGKDQLNKTIDVINRVHPEAIKIHNLNITASTGLYDLYLQGKANAPCATRHIADSVYLLRRIYPDIVIERLICETPSHRLASPRVFLDKNKYLIALDKYFEINGFKQGDLLKI